VSPRARPASPTPAITVPTSTVSPSGTRISVNTPETGEGTSESTLSVETSKSTSSSAMVSPTCLNHLVMVPSVTDSPSWGSWISAMGDSSGCGAGSGGAVVGEPGAGVEVDGAGVEVGGAGGASGGRGGAERTGRTMCSIRETTDLASSPIRRSTGQPCSERPVSARTLSPKSSLRDGWGWMNWATSSTFASQLTDR
jgi:hypothetical protein